MARDFVRLGYNVTSAASAARQSGPDDRCAEPPHGPRLARRGGCRDIAARALGTASRDGPSSSAVLTGWLANDVRRWRRGVDRTLPGSPIDTGASGETPHARAVALPNFYVWWDSKKKPISRPQVMLSAVASRALAEVYRWVLRLDRRVARGPRRGGVLITTPTMRG